MQEIQLKVHNLEFVLPLDSFYLYQNKIKIKNSFSFPDHHKYSQTDFDKIIKDKSPKIVTTKKDYARLNDEQKEICDYVEIDLEIEKRDEFKSLIESHL